MGRPEKHFLSSAFFATVAICTDGANYMKSDVALEARLGGGGLPTTSAGMTGRRRILDMKQNALIAGQISGSTILFDEEKDLMDEVDIKEGLMRRQMGNSRRQLERHDKDANSKDAENIEPNFPAITESPTGYPTQFPTEIPTRIPTAALSVVPSAHPTFLPSMSPSGAPTVPPTVVPSAIPTEKPSAVPSGSPSAAPSPSPSAHPSVSPSSPPSSAPTNMPSTYPTNIPSPQPSRFPSATPSTSPSSTPSIAPTVSPSTAPSAEPSYVPTSLPSVVPSASPSAVPTSSPSDESSGSPSALPSLVPSVHPSEPPSYKPSAMPSFQPTEQLSTMPSMVPTSFPSYTPSISPSPAPSQLPSVGPSIAMSYIPSIMPTNKPSSQPTHEPSLDPSRAPSMAPTFISSFSPSAAPSGEPFLQPSSTPTNECYLNSDGSFGNVSGAPESIVIDYDYEVEVNTTVQSNMIPAVETAINDALLPVLFNDLCKNENDTRRALQEDGEQLVALHGIRRLQAQVAGLSPNPLDSIQTGEPCLNVAKIKSGNSCIVVRGGLSIYGFFTSEDDNIQTSDAVTNAVQAGMEGGAFASAHPSIVRLFLVQRSISTPLSDTEAEVRSADIRADSRGAFPWVIISCISTVFVLGVIYGWNKFSKKKKRQGTDNVDDDAEEALMAKRSLPPLDMDEIPEDYDSASSWQMRGVAVEEMSAGLSDGDETQNTPDVIGALYGIAAAERYLRQLPPGGSQSVSADEMECSSIASSAENAAASVDSVDETHSPLGVSPRNQFKLESIMRANSILFSRRKNDYGDET